jgi:cephalosporin hydroxylase
MTIKQSWKLFDDFLLFGEKDRFAKLWARYELFKMVSNIPGDIVECGVLHGGGALYWARLVEIFNPVSRRKVIGFDTFEGYPKTMRYQQDIGSSSDLVKACNYQGKSPEDIMIIAKSLGLEKRLELIKGDAAITIQDYVRENIGFRAALVNLDFDIYEPTLAALEALYDRVVTGGVIVFDEYGVHEWSESQAVDDFLQDKEVQLRSFSWGFSPTAYMVKK